MMRTIESNPMSNIESSFLQKIVPTAFTTSLGLKFEITTTHRVSNDMSGLDYTKVDPQEINQIVSRLQHHPALQEWILFSLV